MEQKEIRKLRRNGCGKRMFKDKIDICDGKYWRCVECGNERLKDFYDS